MNCGRIIRGTGGYNDVVAGHLALAPEIDEFRQHFERLAAEADALVAPLTEEQFTWRPAAGSWSIAECIDHLNSTARLYLPRLDEGIAEGIRRGLYGEGTERPSARSVQATGAFTVRIRYRPGIDSTMRVVWGGRNLDIVGLGDPTGRRRELRIDCREHPEATT